MRNPNPWWWKARSQWAVVIGGRRYMLGSDRRAAMTRFHTLMANAAGSGSALRAPWGLVEALDRFLAVIKDTRAPSTNEWYHYLLGGFAARWPYLMLNELRPLHLLVWIDEHAAWKPSTKFGAIRAAQTFCRWAVSMQYLSASPLVGMKKPVLAARVELVTLAEVKRMMRASPKTFRHVLRFSWDTGCRPHELKLLEARHWDAAHNRFVLSSREAKGRRVRTIYLPTAGVQRLVARLLRLHPAGPLFRNQLGNRWTGNAIQWRFEHLRKVLGRLVRHYDFRHTWITRKLRAGVDSHLVAALAGHASTEMLDKVYSHVAHDGPFMLQQAARGG